jgi:hypothetical protein
MVSAPMLGPRENKPPAVSFTNFVLISGFPFRYRKPKCTRSMVYIVSDGSEFISNLVKLFRLFIFCSLYLDFRCPLDFGCILTFVGTIDPEVHQ